MIWIESSVFREVQDVADQTSNRHRCMISRSASRRREKETSHAQSQKAETMIQVGARVDGEGERLSCRLGFGNRERR